MNHSAILFGATGQVGRAVYPLLNEVVRVVTPNREAADFQRPETLADLIRAEQPSVVINAAAYTAVDSAELDEQAAITINADAPAAIAQAAAKVGAAVLHFSTDYVFDGKKGAPYTESDVPNPLNVYGRTKLAGDEAIRAVGVPYLIFRTSWVYSTAGRNFLLAIRNRARERKALFVVNDQEGSPTSARLIAHTVATIVRRGVEQNKRFVDFLAPSEGIYNLSTRGTTTWFEFARWILALSNIEMPVTPISTADFGARAPRPRYSGLDTSRLQEAFAIDLPTWIEELNTVLAEEHRI